MGSVAIFCAYCIKSDDFEKMMEIRDEKKKPYALFYMDLDLFKPVNDTYGHEMGADDLSGRRSLQFIQ